MSDFIYLASQSPRRRQLLDQIGVRYAMLLPADDEDAESLEAERAGELAADYVQRVTRAKLDAARERLQKRALPMSPILCADTTVALGDRILGKPADAADAVDTLRLLSGVPHLVITAIAVAVDAETSLYAQNTSVVHLADVDPAEIDAYVASGDAFGKAGAYAIQSRAAAWVSRIEGSYSGIMGLPLFETAQLLKQAGVRF
ncbi:Maf family protein [soil metagenome]